MSGKSNGVKEKKRILQSKFFAGILYFVGKYLFRLRYKMALEFPENMPTEGPILILAKHSSNSDIPLGYHCVKDAFGRYPYSMMKSSLEMPVIGTMILKFGGIPLDRDNPEKSKHDLLYARRLLYDGNIMIIFPEQSRYPEKMGRGRVGAFRFITGKPAEPLMVYSAGYDYEKGFPRNKLTVRFSGPTYYERGTDPDLFLHERMFELAKLSGGFEYKFKAPEGRKKKPAPGSNS